MCVDLPLSKYHCLFLKFLTSPTVIFLSTVASCVRDSSPLLAEKVRVIWKRKQTMENYCNTQCQLSRGLTRMMDLQTHLSTCPKCMSSFQLVFVQCPDTEDCLVSRLYFYIMYFDTKFRITIIDNNKFMNALVTLDTQSSASVHTHINTPN